MHGGYFGLDKLKYCTCVAESCVPRLSCGLDGRGNGLQYCFEDRYHVAAILDASQRQPMRVGVEQLIKKQEISTMTQALRKESIPLSSVLRYLTLFISPITRQPKLLAGSPRATADRRRRDRRTRCGPGRIFRRLHLDRHLRDAGRESGAVVRGRQLNRETDRRTQRTALRRGIPARRFPLFGPRARRVGARRDVRGSCVGWKRRWVRPNHGCGRCFWWRSWKQ